MLLISSKISSSVSSFWGKEYIIDFFFIIDEKRIKLFTQLPDVD